MLREVFQWILATTPRSSISRCTGYVQSGATRVAKRRGSNCRNASIHLQESYGWPEISGGYGKTRRLLTPEEESILLWRCDILQCSGWLQAPEDVRILALEIVQKRDPDAKVGKDWIRNSLYKRHPEIMSRWSQQLDYIRVLRGSMGNYQAIKLFFNNVCHGHKSKSFHFINGALTVLFLPAHRPSGRA